MTVDGWIVPAAVASGGALGAVLRFAASAAGRRIPARFPWATYAINTVGSFLLGALAGGEWELNPAATAALGAGVLGGFTTFSTFAVESARLRQEKNGAIRSALYIGVTLVSSVAAAGLGFALRQLA